VCGHAGNFGKPVVRDCGRGLVLFWPIEPIDRAWQQGWRRMVLAGKFRDYRQAVFRGALARSRRGNSAMRNRNGST
jgi:hypothetical protein